MKEVINIEQHHCKVCQNLMNHIKKHTYQCDICLNIEFFEDKKKTVEEFYITKRQVYDALLKREPMINKKSELFNEIEREKDNSISSFFSTILWLCAIIVLGIVIYVLIF